MTREEEMKNKDNNNKEYEKDLNKLKERILKDGDTLLTKRELLERFCEVDKEYNGSPWNLLQILTNIHILIGEEPCEDVISRKETVDFLRNCVEDYEDKKLRVAFRAASSLVENVDNIPPVTPTCKKCKWILYDYRTLMPREHGNIPNPYWRIPARYRTELRYCPYCGREIDYSEVDTEIEKRGSEE